MKKLLSLTLILVLKTVSTFAAIQEGHFEHDDVHAFVKTTDGNSYGMIWVDHGKKSALSLYRIEEQDDGSQAWIRLTVNQNQMIANNQDSQADYSGTVIEKGVSYLILSPSEYGRSNGVGERLVLRASNEYLWLDLPEQTVMYKSEGERRIERRTNTFSNKRVEGSFEVNGTSFNGTYYVRTPIPQVATLHSRELSAENESGRRISRNIQGFAVHIKGDNFLNLKEYIVFFDLTRGGKIEPSKVLH